MLYGRLLRAQFLTKWNISAVIIALLEFIRCDTVRPMVVVRSAEALWRLGGGVGGRGDADADREMNWAVLPSTAQDIKFPLMFICRITSLSGAQSQGVVLL